VTLDQILADDRFMASLIFAGPRNLLIVFARSVATKQSRNPWIATPLIAARDDGLDNLTTGSSFMASQIINFVHLLSLVCWLGAIIFFSFFTAPAVFKTLDHPTAGELVGVIFPRYYFLGYLCSILLLTTYLLEAQTVSVWKTSCILAIIFGTFTAGMVVQPKARSLKMKIKSSESDEGRKILETRFRRLHSLSVQLNSTVLLTGLVLLWLTAEGLIL